MSEAPCQRCASPRAVGRLSAADRCVRRQLRTFGPDVKGLAVLPAMFCHSGENDVAGTKTEGGAQKYVRTPKKDRDFA
jgi:hypothetical protein